MLFMDCHVLQRVFSKLCGYAFAKSGPPASNMTKARLMPRPLRVAPGHVSGPVALIAAILPSPHLQLYYAKRPASGACIQRCLHRLRVFLPSDAQRHDKPIFVLWGRRSPKCCWPGQLYMRLAFARACEVCLGRQSGSLSSKFGEARLQSNSVSQLAVGIATEAIHWVGREHL